MKTIFSFSLFLFLALALSVNGTAAQDRKDSQKNPPIRNKIKCKKGDDQYIYWAAGKNVFRLPRDPEHQALKQVEDKTARDWFEANQDIPPPNDADEPEGCLQNPLRAGDFPRIYQFEQKKFQEIFGRKIDYRTGLTWTGVYAIPASRSMHVSNERHKKMREEHSLHCTSTSTEMVDCKFLDVQDKSDFKKARIFIVRPPKREGVSVPEEIYVAVQGRGDRLSVRIDYSLLEAIRVDRSFRIAPNEIEKIPQLNQSIIDYIIGSRVENYVWKNSVSTIK